jgi:serpin B
VPAVRVYLPKFHIEGASTDLSTELQALGMKNAFDIPKRSANFDRIAPRAPTDYLLISNVFHRTFLNLDENGTEAAAATAVVMLSGFAVGLPEPIEVHVDHPFLFAIRVRSNGLCLFLGRVTDPL